VGISILDVGTGYGLTDSSRGTYRVNGHSFNPTNVTMDGGQSWDIKTYPNPLGALSIYNPTSTFDLTGFQYGIEVVLGMLSLQAFTYPESITVTQSFTDSYGNILWSWPLSTYLPVNYWAYSYVYMGIKAANQEIYSNGVYNYNYSISYSGGIQSDSVPFTVSNFPYNPLPAYSFPDSKGKIWVEGNNLAFLCSQNGAKILVPTDGTGTPVGTQYAGKIWLEVPGKITYVDEYGFKRNTKMGDRWGWLADPDIPGIPGVDKSGCIWVNNYYNDTFLIIVSPDGIKYRIGAGSIASLGDYQ